MNKQIVIINGFAIILDNKTSLLLLMKITTIIIFYKLQ